MHHLPYFCYNIKFVELDGFFLNNNSVLSLYSFLLKSPFFTAVVFLLYWIVPCKEWQEMWASEGMRCGPLVKSETQTLWSWVLPGLQPTLWPWTTYSNKLKAHSALLLRWLTYYLFHSPSLLFTELLLDCLSVSEHFIRKCNKPGGLLDYHWGGTFWISKEKMNKKNLLNAYFFFFCVCFRLLSFLLIACGLSSDKSLRNEVESHSQRENKLKGNSKIKKKSSQKVQGRSRFVLLALQWLKHKALAQTQESHWLRGKKEVHWNLTKLETFSHCVMLHTPRKL